MLEGLVGLILTSRILWSILTALLIVGYFTDFVHPFWIAVAAIVLLINMFFNKRWKKLVFWFIE